MFRIQSGSDQGGQPCEIQLDAILIPFRRCRPYDRAPRRTGARLALWSDSLSPTGSPDSPEMSAKWHFSQAVKEAEQQRRTAVHHLALVKRGKQQSLFILQDDHVKETVVLTGETFGDMIEILSGQKQGTGW